MWAETIGWLVGLLPLSVIIFTCLHVYFNAPSNITVLEKLRTLTRPTAQWGPAGRPCWIPPKMAQSTYNSVSNARIGVLINGVPIDANASDEIYQL